MNYYRRYAGDYLRDTARLNLTEHGAYSVMLDYYYSDEQPLPADRAEIYLLLRAMRPEDRKAIDKVLDRFFTLEPDGYHQKRVDHEITVSRQARTNGKQGGRPGTGLQTGSKTGLQTGSKTEHETEEGAGLGHPPTTNLQPPTANLPTSSLQPPDVATAPPCGGEPPHPQQPSTDPVGSAAPTRKRRTPKVVNDHAPPPTAETWSAYKDAYVHRYGVLPVRNKTVNGQFAHLIERLGASEAPPVAAFYVRHNRGLYVSAKHPVNLLLRDCEGLRTDWATGRTVTDTEARQADQTQAAGNVWGDLIAEARARG